MTELYYMVERNDFEGIKKILLKNDYQSFLFLLNYATMISNNSALKFLLENFYENTQRIHPIIYKNCYDNDNIQGIELIIKDSRFFTTEINEEHLIFNLIKKNFIKTAIMLYCNSKNNNIKIKFSYLLPLRGLYEV